MCMHTCMHVCSHHPVCICFFITLLFSLNLLVCCYLCCDVPFFNISACLHVNSDLYLVSFLTQHCYCQRVSTTASDIETILIVGSGSRKDVEDGDEFFTQRVAPMLEQMTALNKSKISLRIL